MLRHLRIKSIRGEGVFTLNQSKSRFRYDKMKVSCLRAHRAITFQDGKARWRHHLESYSAAVAASAMTDHISSCADRDKPFSSTQFDLIANMNTASAIVSHRDCKCRPFTRKDL